MLHAAFIVLRIVALAYVGLCLLLVFTQSRAVYYPTRELRETPAAAGLPFENVVLRTADGESIQAWYVPAPRATRTVLVCHGNAGNRGDRVAFIGLLNSLRVNVLMFDYRGYGGSSGRPDEQGTYADALAAWKFLAEERGIAASNIVLFGQSLGGAVAAQLAERVRPGGLVLESTFTSAGDMAAQIYPYLPARWLCRFRYDTLERLPRLACPLLVIHGPDDEMIPFAHAQRNFAAAREPKRLYPIAGGHNDAVLDEAYAATLMEFFASR